MRTLGKRIREWRLLRGLTQSELAEGICSKGAISQYETDKISPTVKILVELSRKLHVSMDILVHGGNVEKSLEEAQKLIEENKFSDALFLLRAIEDYEESPELDFRDSRALLHFHIGSIYLKTNLIDEAIKHLQIAYEQICKHNPSDIRQARKILLCLVRSYGKKEKAHA